MITVILTNAYQDDKTLRYNTNSFDEAVKMFVDDWIEGKIVWEVEELNDAFTPEWLKNEGYPFDGFEPTIEETEVVVYTWQWAGDDQSVTGYFVKSAPIEDGEWPTAGVPGSSPF